MFVPSPQQEVTGYLGVISPPSVISSSGVISPHLQLAFLKSTAEMSAPKSNSLGLLQLYRPDEAVVDICFIHGVYGGNVSTWTSENSCWPCDLLPSDIPDARIISFGYDASLMDFWAPVSENSVEKHALNLVAALVGDRSGSKAAVMLINLFVYWNLER